MRREKRKKNGKIDESSKVERMLYALRNNNYRLQMFCEPFWSLVGLTDELRLTIDLDLSPNGQETSQNLPSRSTNVQKRANLEMFLGLFSL